MIDELHLPPIEDFGAAKNFSVKLSNLRGRLDASFHVPTVEKIIAHIKKYSAEVTTIGDSRISNAVILPGRFKRVYVDEGHGVKFIGGKTMGQLNPSTEKYLSKKFHQKQIAETLGIKENTILVAARGSIGSVAFPSKQFLDWAISDNIIQILSNKNICGYVYIFLSTCYGREIIRKFSYGGVIDAIETEQLKQVPIPLLKNASAQKKINALALASNEKRYEAYKLEQQALKIMEEKILNVV